MIRLALETATAWLGVAVLDGERVLAEFHERRPMEQSAALSPAVREALAGAGAALGDLGEVAVSCGPGSFTGLRVGAAFARALADSLGVPVCPVPTALALALGAVEGGAGNGAARGRAALAAAGGMAFRQEFEMRAGAPWAAGELVRIEYAALAAEAAADGGVLALDPPAAERLAAEAPEAARAGVTVEPRAAWVGIYAQRAGRSGPAREFLPRYGHSPVFRKRVRAT